VIIIKPGLNFVISITINGRFLVENDFMEHRRVRYAIPNRDRKGAMAMHLPGQRKPKERTVFGTRKDAETTARLMIDACLKSTTRRR
jgi:hypothetical protein